MQDEPLRDCENPLCKLQTMVPNWLGSVISHGGRAICCKPYKL